MNAQLVKIDVAAADMAVAIRRIEVMVDGGTLLDRGLSWVFDLSNDLDSTNGKCGSHRRELRFWRPEILARANPDVTKHRRFNSYEIEWVINKILPPVRVNFHAGEVDQLLQIRPRTRIDFGEELNGKMKGGSNFYSRKVLASFLTRRWIGASRTGNQRPAAPITSGKFHPAHAAKERDNGMDAKSGSESRFQNKALSQSPKRCAVAG